jgi:hypothetical protein
MPQLNKSTFNKAKKRNSTSVWKGPYSRDGQGGVTQSMLGGFLVCRERFRIRYIEGMGHGDKFFAAIEYGNFWHICEEFYEDDWKTKLQEEVKGCMKKYPLQQEEIKKWWKVCLNTFPIYRKFWEKHKDDKGQKTLLPEVSFKVPYELPSGRVVILRGKWDRVVSLQKKIWLGEHKSKGTVDEEALSQQLSFDMQTLIYLTTLDIYMTSLNKPYEIGGVLYNVVRRPLAGGKGSIRQRKPTKTKPGETDDEYYGRLSEIIRAEPEEFFMRWKVDIDRKDLDRFQTNFLNPQLEQLCDWWEWIEANISDPFANGNKIHWRHPYGIYNPLTTGRGTTDLDAYLLNGNSVGLVRSDKLFGELDDNEVSV